MQSRKALKLFMISGLLIALVVSLRKKSKFGLLAIAYVLVSPYRNLLRYIKAQAQLESANFTSNVYKVDNNMFGMKVNSREYETPGIPSPEDGIPYAHYRNDFDSLRDFIAYLKQTSFPTSVSGTEEYAAEMKKRYKYGPTAMNYADNLNFWIYGNS